MTPLRMRVARIDSLTPTIRRLHLVAADGRPLPPFEAGAHLGVHVPLGERSQRRAYSLVNPGGEDAHYEIAVLLEPAGSGGSRWMHALEVGQLLEADPPRNDFRLATDARRHLLIAGGIGITPILAMARTLAAAGAPHALHYAARDAAAMAYRDEVAALAHARCWFDGGDPRRGLPLADTIGTFEAGTHLYVCGPAGLVAATLDTARRLGWPDDALHSELFAAPAAPTDADAAFEVHLAASGRVLAVPAGTSVLDAMIAAGLDPLYDCRRGDCGVCTAQLLDGEPEHRDICLTGDEHAEGRFCPCVSRAKSARLVLDL
ncbi:PDR/VanB family oxidoreductase [Burkholderia gladioli]|jgi:ferredoxin-NADP reductase|uniref:2Fe-2S iron-sulfur cluster binding domain protein n=1 Tax=Burkholderia gladioli TaxID=28095 RepID=A0AAW3F2B2_BURGA|nr:PDR/VanB family oxidoreductase [Burkholderia gladioli]AJW94695.1 2Fe-2S iron-sulfur cluster binding domain protein [Burkholderia gladioli]ASD83459.1 oxidoreductase [Burkholderia gladioli pv. gladioli]AWY50886.1 oxidoreductase [Burkholderia gladioli pv. gladioli]KGC15379.1 2Fe-2S iron-sulfur cluster binding domain protein [Burkholderia gladioli]MBU9640764.1 PDR/VanB family oxidoreductase [Burkholderia gladioli]